MDSNETTALSGDELHAELERVVALGGEARLEAIIDSPLPTAVVQAMSNSEAFYTFIQLEEEGRRALLKLVADEQLDFLLDLDLWDRDRIDPDKALDWLERMAGADPELAANWLRRVDSELVLSICKQLVTVNEGRSSSQDSMTEAQDRLPPFTAEGIYFIQFASERASSLLRAPLLLLASADMEYYLSLMQDLIVVPPTELEETAFKQRWCRLRDEGFLPSEEAYEIYRWPTEQELEGLEADATPPATPDREIPSSALTLVEPQGTLVTAFGACSASRRRQLSREVALASTRVLAADHLPFGELEGHRQALEKTLGLVEIGLSRVAEADPRQAAAALESQGIMPLFRLGVAEVAKLGRRASVLRRQGWLSQIGLGLEVLGEPLEQMVRTLSRKRPLYPAAALEGEARDRPFRAPLEVARCGDLLARVEALKGLFIDGLGLDLAPARSFDLEDCVPPDVAELTLGLIFRTALAHWLLDQRLGFRPVEAADLGQLVTAIGALDRQQAAAELLARLSKQTGEPSSEDRPHIIAFVDENLDILCSALGGIDLDRGIDPRFVGAVVIHVVH